MKRHREWVPIEPAEFVVVYLGPVGRGGAIEAIIRLKREWTAAGIVISLIMLGGDTAPGISDGRRIIVGPAPSRRNLESSWLDALKSAGWFIALLRQVRHAVRDRPDAVVLPFLSGTALVTLAATVGLPNRIVVCERTDVSRHRVSWHVRLLRRILYPRAAAITVNSSNPAASDLLRKVSRGRPVHVVPNPNPRDMEPADPANSRVILAVGRLVEQKRHATLIEAFAAIAGRIPDWSVVIVGEGPLRGELEAQIDRLDLTDRVMLVGQVDDPRPFYASAGLFVLPSDYEGTSNALLEAASAGLPCIVTATAAPAAADDTFRVFPPGNVNLLARYLQDLCEAEENRRAAGAAAMTWLQDQGDGALEAWTAALNLRESS